MLRLVVTLDVDTPRSPREHGEYFLERIREALIRAVGRADTAVLDEFWRVLPERERSQ
jgi:hypothetical protein